MNDPAIDPGTSEEGRLSIGATVLYRPGTPDHHRIFAIVTALDCYGHAIIALTERRYDGPAYSLHEVRRLVPQSTLTVVAEQECTRLDRTNDTDWYDFPVWPIPRTEHTP